MADIAGKTHHVRINGKGYMLRDAESYVVEEAPIFGVTRFSTGDPSYNDSTLGRWWAQTDWSGGIKTNEEGYIIVNDKNETNIKGVFAAGDVADIPFKQYIIAAGEGAKAALAAHKYIQK